MNLKQGDLKRKYRGPPNVQNVFGDDEPEWVKCMKADEVDDNMEYLTKVLRENDPDDLSISTAAAIFVDMLKSKQKSSGETGERAASSSGESSTKMTKDQLDDFVAIVDETVELIKHSKEMAQAAAQAHEDLKDKLFGMRATIEDILSPR